MWDKSILFAGGFCAGFVRVWGWFSCFVVVWLGWVWLFCGGFLVVLQSTTALLQLFVVVATMIVALFVVKHYMLLRCYGCLCRVLFFVTTSDLFSTLWFRV